MGCDGGATLSAQHAHLADHEHLTAQPGPSSLSINDARALQLIHGAGSKCTKGPWYVLLDPMYSLQTERDPGVHAQRRRVWDRGFSTKGGFFLCPSLETPEPSRFEAREADPTTASSPQLRTTCIFLGRQAPRTHRFGGTG